MTVPAFEVNKGTQPLTTVYRRLLNVAFRCTAQADFRLLTIQIKYLKTSFQMWRGKISFCPALAGAIILPRKHQGSPVIRNGKQLCIPLPGAKSVLWKGEQQAVLARESTQIAGVRMPNALAAGEHRSPASSCPI